jgi:fucose 4-O-acetylase-like acetyltransferase
MKTSDRLTWIDAARGAAILVVIAYHVDVGMRASGVALPGYLWDWLAPVDLVRMPLLVFLSGFALHLSRPSGRAEFVLRRLSKIAWPFVIWALAYNLAWHLFPTGRNSRDLAEVVLSPFYPQSHLWFLQALILYTLTILLLIRFRTSLSLLAALAVSLSVGFSEAQLGDDVLMQTFVPHRALYVWFVLGFVLAGSLRSVMGESRPAGRAGLGLAALLLFALIGPSLAETRYLPQSMPISALGVAGVVLLVSCLQPSRLLHKVLTAFGTRSLEIYVLHILIIAALRPMLVRSGLVRRSPARQLFLAPSFGWPGRWAGVPSAKPDALRTT